jgi:excisionase family DNA binding protein
MSATNIAQLLTARELAERLSISRGQLRRLIGQGRIPSVEFGRCTTRFDVAAVRKALGICKEKGQ